MACVTLHMTIRNSEPGITRTVVVDAGIALDELHEVTCAAFGFSGLQEHSFTQDPPGPGEQPTALSGLLDGGAGEVTYHYGNPDGDTWIVDLLSLGHPQIPKLVPQLIDATGPDVVEGCGGPEAMSAMREVAVRAQAQLDVDTDAADLITIFLPGLSPDRVAQRLAYTDPASVAHRVAFAAPPQMIEGAGESGTFHDGEGSGMTDDPAGWGVPGAFGLVDVNPWDIRSEEPEEVPEQLPEEDRHRLDAETIEEIRDALSQVIPEDADSPEAEEGTPLDNAAAEQVTESIRWFLDYLGEGRPLTQAGYLKPADVQAVAAHLEAEKYWYGKFNREIETLPVLNFRDVLTHLKLVRKYKGKVMVTRKGRELSATPLELARHIAARLPLLYEVSDLPNMLEVYANWHDGEPGPRPLTSEAYAGNYQLFLAMNVMERSQDPLVPKQATPAGKRFIAEVFSVRTQR